MDLRRTQYSSGSRGCRRHVAPGGPPSLRPRRPKPKSKLLARPVPHNYVGKHNIIIERAQVNSRCQQDGGSAESSVHKLAENFVLEVLKEELIRDRTVVGITDKRHNSYKWTLN